MQPRQSIAIGSDEPSRPASLSIGGGHGNTVATKCRHCGVETVAPIEVSAPPPRVIAGHLADCPGRTADA